MALKFFGNVNKAEADLESTDKLVQADCEKSGVKSAMRDGKVISLSDATTSEKYAALRAAQPSGEDLESRAQLVQRNGIIAAELEATSVKLTAAQATVASLTQENAQAKSKIETLEASNATLTSEKSNQINLRDAAVKENANLAKEVSNQKLALAKDCLAWGCVDFKAADGKALAKDASDADLAKSAEAMSFADLHTAHKGAINSSMAKLGGNIVGLPAAGVAGAAKSAGGILAQLNAITDPNARTQFYRENKALIAAAKATWN